VLICTLEYNDDALSFVNIMYISSY